MLGGYRGTVVVDGFAVYEVLARDGPGFALAHCWAHTKRHFDEIAEHWPTACAEIGALIGELYAIERRPKAVTFAVVWREREYSITDRHARTDHPVARQLRWIREWFFEEKHSHRPSNGWRFSREVAHGRRVSSRIVDAPSSAAFAC